MLVAAHITPGGTPAHILKAAEEGRYKLVVSEHLLEELRDVLTRSKFRRCVPVASVPAYLDRLRSFATLEEEGEILPVSADPDDDYLLALGRDHADYLVTGDPHLLDLPNKEDQMRVV